MPDQPTVSVIVPTKNVIRTIEACLVSSGAQVGVETQVIVIDNHSTDGTTEVAEKLADVFELRGPERSAQRNRGMELATGDWLVWIDADMILPPTLLAGAIAKAEAAGAEAVFIPETTIGPGFWSACRALERRCYVGEPMIEAPRLMTRELAQRIGTFVEDVSGQEDAEYRMRIRDADVTTVYADVAIDHDEGRLTVRDVLRKRVYYGRSIPAYAAHQPGAVSGQLGATVRAYARHWKLLLAHPVLAAGMFTLRAAEAAAYAWGAWLGARDLREKNA